MKKLVPVLKPIIDRPPSWPESTLAEDEIRKTLPEEKEKLEPASS
jgi:hypothetical protein